MLEVRKGQDSTTGSVTRQYNDDENRDNLWGIIDDLHELIEDEFDALHGYADFLESDNPHITDAHKAVIAAIMQNEKDHAILLQEIVKELDGLEPNSNVAELAGVVITKEGE
jgi:hypothetical protein